MGAVSEQTRGQVRILAIGTYTFSTDVLTRKVKTRHSPPKGLWVSHASAFAHTVPCARNAEVSAGGQRLAWESALSMQCWPTGSILRGQAFRPFAGHQQPTLARGLHVDRPSLV